MTLINYKFSPIIIPVDKVQQGQWFYCCPPNNGERGDRTLYQMIEPNIGPNHESKCYDPLMFREVDLDHFLEVVLVDVEINVKNFGENNEVEEEIDW